MHDIFIYFIFHLFRDYYILEHVFLSFFFRGIFFFKWWVGACARKWGWNPNFGYLPDPTLISSQCCWSSCIIPKLCTTWNQQQPAWNETRSWVPCCIWNAPYFFHTYFYYLWLFMRKLKTLSTQPLGYFLFFYCFFFFLKNYCRSRLRNTNQQLDSGVQKLHLATMQLKRVSGIFDHEITGKFDDLP